MKRRDRTSIVPVHSLLLAGLLIPGQLGAAVQINEFMVDNPGRPNDPDALLDMDGNSPGWVELYNNGDAEVVLSGWALSDDPTQPGKWIFATPSPGESPTVIPPKGFRIVYCGGLPRNLPSVEPHTHFKLNDHGSIQLAQPDGTGSWNVVSRIGSALSPYPNQRRGVSFGFPNNDSNQPPVYFEHDTPNASNTSPGVVEFCADPSFSVRRGFQEAPFTLILTNSTPGATLSYTLNGDIPSPTHGIQVPPPSGDFPPTVSIQISSTTLIRARVWKPGLGSSHVETHSYLFASDVLNQRGPLPSMGLSDGDTFNWGATGGDLRSPAGPDWAVDPDIVNHPLADNRFTKDDLKRLPVVSIVTSWVEAFGPKSVAVNPPPVDKRGFYVGAAVGVANERADRQASLELINPEGDPQDPNLRQGFQVDGRVHVFGGTSQNRWKSYKLSMSFHAESPVHSKVYGDDASAEQEVFILDARLNQAWVHPDATQRSRGDYVRDHVMADLQNQLGGASFHSRPVHCFLNGLYWGLYILHEKPDARFAASYLGGDSHEWDIFKHSGAMGVDGGTLFDNVISSGVINPSKALGSTSDPSTAAFFNSTTLQEFEELLDRVGLGRVLPNPVVSVSTRQAFERVAEKLDIPGFIDYLLLNFVAANSDWAHKNLYASYRRGDPNAKWRWHSWDAEHVFRLESENSVTKNDPYGPTAIHAKLAANSEYRLLFADGAHRRIFNNGPLSAVGLRAAFNRRFAEIEPAGIRGESARWGDNRSDNLPYTYLGAWTTEKKRILDVICTVRGGTALTGSPTTLSQLRAAGLYPGTLAPEFRDGTTDSVRHGGFVQEGFHLKLANPGANPGVIYYTLDGSDPREAWTGSPLASALKYQAPIELHASTTVRSRVLNGDAWSALNEAFFSVGTKPASGFDLAISELHYRPAPPSASEVAAGFTQRAQFEFVEVMNISRSRVSLEGVHFGAGLDFAFDTSNPIRELAPGERVLIVANTAAFQFRYGPGKPVAGEFRLGSNLDDSGERLQLLAADGQILRDFTYNDRSPWPEAADGDGFSLTLIHPESNPAHDNPHHWRPSRSVHGTPGSADVTRFPDWARAHGILNDTGDEDSDGRVNLLEYLVGSNPAAPETQPILGASVTLSENGEPTLFIAFSKDPSAEDVLCTPEFSSDLVTWSSDAVRISIQPGRDGLQTEVWRSTAPLNSGSQVFARLRVDRRPLP